MTIYAYCRVSTEEQALGGTSIERQQDLLLAHSPNAVLVVDPGYSGSTEKRPGWSSMCARLRKGDTVLATDLSRLHRNAMDALSFSRRCQRDGIRLVMLHENVDLLSANGALMHGMLSVFNEHKSNETKEKTRRALARKRERGEKLGGIAPYGWRAEGGKLVPCPHEQQALALMKALREEGLSARSIGYRLFAAGYLTKAGNPYWHPKVVLSCLRRAS